MLAYQNGADVLSCEQYDVCDLYNNHHAGVIHNACTLALPRTNGETTGEDRGGTEGKKVRHREEGRRDEKTDERDGKVKLTQRDRSRDLHRAI